MKINQPFSPESPEIQALLRDCPLALPVFLHLAGRNNNAKATKSVAVENLFGAKREEITLFWRKLQSAGCGQFIKKWDNKSHFKWDSRIKTREFCEKAILKYWDDKESNAV